MEFEYSQEHRALKKSVRDFVDEVALPQIMEYEEKSVLPMEIFRRTGSEGFLRAHIPKSFGGLGLGTLGFCLVSEELARAGAGMIHNGQFQTQKMLLEHGTVEQREKYLEKLLNGEYLAATAITEPNVGSSFAGMETTVSKRGDCFVLNGKKTLINDAAEANVLNIFARSEEGISVFLLDRGTPGFRVVGKLDPLGMRSSPVYELELRDCTVGPNQIVGALGRGLDAFFSAFNFSRLGNASAALGIGTAAFEKTLDYLRGRQVGTRMASEFQGLRWMLAEMSTDLEAARLMRDRAAYLEENRQDIGLVSSQTKLLCVEVANRVVGNCIQATGRYGCLRESLFDLYLRDVKVLGTAGGSLEVMKNNIARHLTGG